MNPLNIKALIPEYTYFVKHSRNSLKPRKIIFKQLIYFESSHAEFEYPDSKTRTTLREDEWNFYDSAQTLIARRTAINLVEHLCEDVVGIIERFVVGNKPHGSGPDRYILPN